MFVLLGLMATSEAAMWVLIGTGVLIGLPTAFVFLGCVAVRGTASGAREEWSITGGQEPRLAAYFDEGSDELAQQRFRELAMLLMRDPSDGIPRTAGLFENGRRATEVPRLLTQGEQDEQLRKDVELAEQQRSQLHDAMVSANLELPGLDAGDVCNEEPADPDAN